MTCGSKILQVCPKYFPSIGGVEEHVRRISEKLTKTYKLAVATTDPSGELEKEETINGVQVRRFNSWAPSEAYYFSGQLKKYLAENSDDYMIVHAHSYHAFPALYAAQTKAGNKLVFTPHYHGSGHSWFRKLLHKPYKLLGKKIFEKSDRVISVSKFERNLILSNFNISDNKVIVVPNGVDLEEFTYAKEKKEDTKVILSVGRIEEYKGMQYLIRVLPMLHEDITLEIVGRGPYKDKLVILAKKQGVASRVRFYQDLSREQVLQKYADADIFALLSKYEAFSITVAEALASQRPCIVGNASALREWIDNKNCFGIDYPIDLNELAGLVNEVIGKRVNNVNLPSWEDAARIMRAVYEECVS